MINITQKAKLQQKNDQINDLLEEFERMSLGRRLNYIYQQIPGVPQCERCAKCCFMSAEVYFLEYLNIYRHLKTLPKKEQHNIVKGIISHELLNLATLEYQCPFLNDKACVIYDYRPIACRIFGLYPEVEYEDSRKTSLKNNRELGDEYRKYYGVKVSKKVVDYDIKQCGNNIGSDGKPVIVSKLERSRLKKLIIELENDLLESVSVKRENRSSSFAGWFLSEYFSDKEMHHIRVSSLRAYQDKRFNDELLDQIIDQYKIQI